MSCKCGNNARAAYVDHNGCLRLNIAGSRLVYCPDANGGGGDCDCPEIINLQFNSDSNTLRLITTDGSFTTDLSTLAEDNYVNGVTYDEDTGILTLSRSGGLSDLTVEIPSNATELPEGTEGQVVGYGDEGQLVAMDLPEPPEDEDHYVESASFDDETRILTLARTEPLGSLTVTIPSDATELPEGVEGQVIGYGEGGTLIATDFPEPPEDEDHYVESVGFNTETRTLTLTRTTPLAPLTANIPSDATVLPEGQPGQVIGYNSEGDLEAVDLPVPPADEDHYVESASFDDETRVLTLTRTDPLDPLTVAIPSDADEAMDRANQAISAAAIADGKADQAIIDASAADLKADQALTNSLPRDGSAGMTGNLPMGGNRITGLAAAVNAGDAVRLDQVTLASAFQNSVSGLSLAANEMVYASGANVAAKTALTPFARTLLDDSNAATARATLDAASTAVATTGANGLMSSGDKTKLNGIAAGAQVNVPTNLGTSRNTTSVTITSSTGSNVSLPAATTSAAGVMTSADKTKLNAIDTPVENAGGVSAMRRMTQAAYDALSVKDPNTFYVIVG